jgi:hypothetical protein
MKPSPSLVLLTFALLALAKSASAQTTFSSVLNFVPTSVSESSSSGWTDSAGLEYNAIGLNLDWTSGTWEITNIADVMGAGPNLGRYISTVFDAPQEYEMTLFRGRRTFDILDAGESFQIRSSYDNFAAPLAIFEGIGGTTTAAIPGTDTGNTFFFNVASDLSGLNSEPLEVRFYYYGDNPDLDGSPGFQAPSNLQNYTVSLSATAAVPEPSSLLLLGIGSALLMGFRSRNSLL